MPKPIDSKPVDKDTRYFIDLDLQSGQILGWDYDNRHLLIAERPPGPFHHRVYISQGQYNKLVQHHRTTPGATKPRDV